LETWRIIAPAKHPAGEGTVLGDSPCNVGPEVDMLPEKRDQSADAQIFIWESIDLFPEVGSGTPGLPIIFKTHRNFTLMLI
jgi:hypothetical protein